MDNGEALQQFCSMTGADTDFALSFLEENGWDVELCINLYLEGNIGTAAGLAPGNAGTPKLGGMSAGFSSSPPPPVTPPSRHDDWEDAAGLLDQQGSAGDTRTMSDADIARAMSEEIPPEIYSDGGVMDDDGVRAPILPKSEVLVEDDPYYLRQLRRAAQKPRSGDPNNVFEMFRDLNRESRAPTKAPEDQYNKKLKTLADLFRPPVDLLEPGTFDDVKNIAQHKKKWLLVNIQEVSVFECQMMNRDTWSDAGVKSIVRSHFVLWQVLKPSEEGARYCRFYPVDILPHIAIIDSRTGERLDVVEGFMEPAQLIEMLEKFVATHSLEDTKPSRPRTESPTKRLGDLSEEAQLAAAMAASLGKAGDPITIPSDFSSSTSTTTTSAPPTTTTTTSTTSTSNIPPPSVPAPSVSTPPVVEQKVEPPKPAAPPIPDNFKEEHANPSAERSCVIQIRTPSGAIKGHFRPEDTLFTVWQYVSLHLEPNTQFNLVTSFPKTTYSGEKLNMTLKQAELVPRAVLICELN